MRPKKITKPLDIYVRVSDVRGRSGESFISTKEQEKRCRDAIAARNLKVGEVFEDLDVSGGKMSRPELNKALERIRDGVSGGIVVARLDRFGRTVARALLTMEEINEAGGVVITAEGDFDTSTAVGELVLNFMLSLAAFELRRIRENWTAAQTRAVDRGIHVSRFAPAGYRRHEDKMLEPDGKNAKTVSEAFRMAADGASYTKIAAYLNERHLSSGGGDTYWKSNRIRRLLANRVYLGEARYGSIANASAHKPLVDEATWTLAQRKPVGPILKESSEYLLTGICRCAECRYAMRPQKARGRTVGTYRCQDATATGRCPHPSSISMNRLDAYVIEQLLARAPEVVGEQLGEDESEAVEVALEADRKYKAELTNIDLRDKIGEADHDQIITARYDAWQEALARIPAPSRSVATPDSIDLPALIAELQERGDVAGLRELLGASVQAVLVSPALSRSRTAPISERVRIVWNDEAPLRLPKRGERFNAEAAYSVRRR